MCDLGSRATRASDDHGRLPANRTISSMRWAALGAPCAPKRERLANPKLAGVDRYPSLWPGWPLFFRAKTARCSLARRRVRGNHARSSHRRRWQPWLRKKRYQRRDEASSAKERVSDSAAPCRAVPCGGKARRRYPFDAHEPNEGSLHATRAYARHLRRLPRSGIPRRPRYRGEPQCLDRSPHRERPELHCRSCGREP